MSTPTDVEPSASPSRDAAPEDGVIMAVLARRAGMTEGQLYTAVIAALVVLVLTLTGLPGAHDLADPTGAGSVAPPPPPPTSVAATTTSPETAP